MKNACPYCSSLMKAIPESNYCSNLGDDMSKVGSNAFYFKTNSMDSGQHISRLTIRGLCEGYQLHKIGNEEVLLDASKYLVVNEGQLLESHLNTREPVEGMIVAFDYQLAQQLQYHIQATLQQLLDNPFERLKNYEFTHFSIPRNPQLQSHFQKIKNALFQEGVDTLYFSECILELMSMTMVEYEKILQQINGISAKKFSTKMELFRRLSKARNYIDANLEKEITLEQLSWVATMSPFHFLRSFKELFSISPYQYLTKKRIQRAGFLLKNTDLMIGQVAVKVGYNTERSFRRTFFRVNKLSPSKYRIG